MSFQKFAVAQVLSAEIAPVDQGGLRRFAHRHHFDYTPRPGYLYVRSRAISSRCNDNFDEFPAQEIKKAYRTFVGKPVFVNHKNENHKRARGVVIDAALHEDTNPDGSPDTWAEVLMEVDAVRFPKLAEAVVKGEVDRTSMGTDVAFSRCSVCNNKASTPLEYCQHIPAMKGKRIYRSTASGTKEGILVREICYGLGFFENSLLVEEPADPTAYTFGVDSSAMSATASRTAALLPPDHGEHGPWNLHGQCVKCGYTPPTEDDEPCDHEWCKGFPEGWHTKGEHIDPADRDPNSDASRAAEKSLREALPEGDDAEWLLSQQPQGPSHQRNHDEMVSSLPYEDRTGEIHPAELDTWRGKPDRYYPEHRPNGTHTPDATYENWGLNPTVMRRNIGGGAERVGHEPWTPPEYMHPAERHSQGYDEGRGRMQSLNSRTAAQSPQQDFADGVMKTYQELGGKPNTWPTVAGAAVRARDTGRLLMLQRSMADEKDPAAGKWEFPGGHAEDGESLYDAAVREWQEETGHQFPQGDPEGVWHSPNGVYRGYLHTVPNEDAVPIHDLNARQQINPDDPDGDDTESLAWLHPNELKHNPAVRDEVRKGTNWDLLGATKHEKAAAVDGSDHGSLDDHGYGDDDLYDPGVRISGDWQDKTPVEKYQHLSQSHGAGYLGEDSDESTLDAFHHSDHEDWGHDQDDPHTHDDAPAHKPVTVGPPAQIKPGDTKPSFALPAYTPPNWADKSTDDKRRHLSDSHGFDLKEADEATLDATHQHDHTGELDEKSAPYITTHSHGDLPEVKGTGGTAPPNYSNWGWGGKNWKPGPPPCTHDPAKGCPHIPKDRSIPPNAVKYEQHADEFWVKCDQGHRHYGEDGASGILVRHKGPDGQHRFLMQNRAGWTDHGGTWSVPGGAIGRGETPYSSSKREAEEEVGDLGNTKHAFTHTLDHGGWAYHTVVADVKKQPDFGFGVSSEADGHAWVKKQDIDRAAEQKGFLHPGFREAWPALRAKLFPKDKPFLLPENRVKLTKQPPPSKWSPPKKASLEPRSVRMLNAHVVAMNIHMPADKAVCYDCKQSGTITPRSTDHKVPCPSCGSNTILHRTDRKTAAEGEGHELGRNLWDKFMDVIDPGGSPEGRHSERNLRAGQDLLKTYQPHEISWTPDDEGGEPYAVAHHDSGWSARDYGGPLLSIHHRATGEDEHDALDVSPHGDAQGPKPAGWNAMHLQDHLNRWVEGYGKDFAENMGDSRIRRWQRRQRNAVLASGPIGHGTGRTTGDGGHERQPCVTCGKDIYRVGEGSHKHWQHDLDSGAGVPHQARPAEESVTKAASVELQQHLRTLHMVDEGLLRKRDPEYLHQLAHEYMAEHPEDHDVWDPNTIDPETGRPGVASGRSSFHVHDGSQVLSRRRLAYGEIKAPEDVDTLRDDSCPVCGDSDAFDGDECQVCGFVAPPKMFQDPDLDVAKQMDLRKDVAAEEAGGNPSQPVNPDEQLGEQDPNMLAEDEPVDPAQLDENGDPIEGEITGTDPTQDPALQEDPNAEQIDPEGQPLDPSMTDGTAPAEQGEAGYATDAVPDLICPACHAEFSATQPQSTSMNDTTDLPEQAAVDGEGGNGMLEGDACPNCGMGALTSIVSGQPQPQQPVVANLFVGV